MAAICLTSLVSLAFILIGQVNVLASIVTINFMLTYSFVDYSYFSVAMTLQLQTKEKMNKRNQRGSTRQSCRPLIEATAPSYGSVGESPQGKGTLLEFTKDMDQIFPAGSNVDDGAVLSSRCKGRRASVTTKQKLMDSFGLDLNSNMFSEEKVEEMSSAPPHDEAAVQCGGTEPDTGEEPQVKCHSKIHHAEQDSSADPQNHSAGDQL